MNAENKCEVVGKQSSSDSVEKLIGLCIEHFDYEDAIVLAEAYYNRVKTEQALFVLAQTFAKSRNFESAYDLLKRNNFQSPQCRFLFAKSAYSLNRLQEAEASLRDETIPEHVFLHPSFMHTTPILPFAHSLLAKILCETNRVESAKFHWRSAIKLNPLYWSQTYNYCEIGGENVREIFTGMSSTNTRSSKKERTRTRKDSRPRVYSPDKKSTTGKKRQMLSSLKKNTRARTRSTMHPLSSVNSPNISLPIDHATDAVDFDDDEPMDSENTPSSQAVYQTEVDLPVGKNEEKETASTDLVHSDISDWLMCLGEVRENLTHFRCADALALISEIPLNFSQLPLTLEMRARIFFENAEYRRSCEIFEEIRRLYPKRVEGMEIYSTALWQLQDSHKLSTLSADIMSIARDQPQTWCIVGNCFSLEKQREMAIECLERAIRLDSRFGYAYSLLGHELIDMNDLTKAAQAFRQAILYMPSDYRVLYGLGLVYFKEEQLQLARIHLQRAVKIHPTNTVLLCQLAIIEQAQHMTESAMKNLETALKHSPNNVPCRYHKARLLFDVGKYNEALQELKELKLLSPDEAYVFFLLGRVHRKLGNKNEALKNFNFATEIDPRGDQNQSRISEQGPYDDDPIQ